MLGCCRRRPTPEAPRSAQWEQLEAEDAAVPEEPEEAPAWARRWVRLVRVQGRVRRLRRLWSHTGHFLRSYSGLRWGQSPSRRLA